MSATDHGNGSLWQRDDNFVQAGYTFYSTFFGVCCYPKEVVCGVAAGLCQDVGTCPCEANVPLIKGDKMKVPIDQASGFTIGLTLVLVTLQLAYRMRPTLRDLALHQATRQAAAPLCAIGSEPFFPRLEALKGVVRWALVEDLDRVVCMLWMFE